MKNFSNNLLELFTKFNGVTFFNEPHKYYLNGNELLSVTTLIHEYQEDFDEKYWLTYKENQLNIPQWKIKRAWDFINKKGTLKGSIIHDYAENILLNKVFKYPKDEILNEFGFDPILPEYKITKKHVDNFIKISKNRLIPIKTEFVIYDEKSLIGGMVDIIFYNIKENEFQIWDHKTNKSFSMENKNKHLLDPLSTIEDCDLEIYSLQLALYKRIIERNTSFKFGKSYVVWYSHNNSNFKIIKTKDRDYFADLLIDKRINELKDKN